MAHRIGFEGNYVIYDLPEFLLLQQYFLEKSQVDFEKLFFLSKDDLNSSLVPCDVLVGIYSLSEMPFHERGPLLAAFPAKSALFLYSGNWESYDNVTWFMDQPGTWQHQECQHHNDPNNWYSFKIP